VLLAAVSPPRTRATCASKRLSLPSPRWLTKLPDEVMTVIKSIALQIKVARGSAKIVFELLFIVLSSVCVVA